MIAAKPKLKAIEGSFCARGPAFMKEVETAASAESSGLLTRFAGLDSAFGGLRGLNILGGLPGGLKTSFAIQIGVRVLSEEGTGVLMFSAEMRAPRAMKMACSMLTGIPRHEIERGALADVKNKEGRAEFERFVNDEGRRFILRDAQDDLSSDALAAEVLRVREQLKVERLLVVADSLQYLTLRQPPSSQWSEKGRLDRLTACLMEIADEGRTCVLAVSHLPKSKAVRDGDVFQFLGSAGIDYSADATMTLEWERAAAPRTHGGTAGVPGLRECPVALRIWKNRWGAPDLTVDFLATPATGRFMEVEGDHE